MRMKNHKPDYPYLLDAIQRRKLATLYHYTPRANLPSILKHGILSRQAMRAKHIEPVHFHYWGHKWKQMEDYLCLCITPPRGMLKKETMKMVAVTVEPSIIAENGVYFSPLNSAKNEIVLDDILSRDTLDAFEDIFRYPEGLALKNDMVEIVVQGEVPKRFIRSVILPEWDSSYLLHWTAGICGLGPEIIVNPSLF